MVCLIEQFFKNNFKDNYIPNILLPHFSILAKNVNDVTIIMQMPQTKIAVSSNDMPLS